MVLIREFSPTDIGAVSRIVKRSLGETYPPSLYLTVHGLWREGFLLVTDEGQPVAFVASVVSGPKTARVLMLAVLPEHRKRSFGKMLMAELYRRCASKGLDTVVLEVRKSNRSALTFYKNQGFSVFGEIERFYSNGEDAYKMMKVIQS